MIQLRTNAGEVSRALRDLATEYPRESVKALVTFSIGMKGEGGRAVKTGNAPKLGLNLGFKPLSKLTKLIRRSGANRFGGKLAKSVKSFSQGDHAFIGWPDGLAKFGDEFQSSDVHPFRKEERHYFHRYRPDIDPKLYGGSSKRENRRKRRSAKFGVTDSSRAYYNRPARDVWRTIRNAPGTGRYMLRVFHGKIGALIDAKAKRVAKVK